MNKNSHLFLIGGFLLLSFFTMQIFMQKIYIMNFDVGYLLHATVSFVNGGVYGRNFFTPNTPMIFYLYSPVVLLHDFFTLSWMLSYFIYISIVTLFLLLIINHLLKKIFNNYFQSFIYVMTLSFSIIVLSGDEWGQRDQLFFMLILPYVLLVVLRLMYWQNESTFPCSSNFSILVGILAGVGVGIKPWFFLTPFLLATFSIYKVKTWRFFMKAEYAALIITLCVYMLIIVCYEREYLTLMLPFLLRNYYVSFSHQIIDLTFYPVTLVTFVPLIILFKKSQQNLFAQALSIVLISFILIYYAQKNILYYHLLPAASLSLLLFVHLFYQVKQEQKNQISHYGALLGVIILIIIYLLQDHSLFFEKIYLVILAALYFASISKYKLISFNLLLILTLSIYGAFLYGRMTFLSHYQHYVLKPLKTYLLAQPQHERSLHFFVRFGWFMYPLAYLTNAKPLQKEDSLYPIRNYLSHNNLLTLQQKKDKDFLLNLVADDLIDEKPVWVFEDNTDSVLQKKDNPRFSFVQFFSENARFRAEWRYYCYVKTIYFNEAMVPDVPGQLLVYKRKKVLTEPC